MISTDVIKIIDDCYNANPTSVKAAVETLCNIKGGRKVAVLGDMKELGENEISLHKDVGEYASKCGVDELAKNIGDSADIAEIYHFDTVDNAIQEIDTVLHKDDIVLVKASHSMHFERIVEFLKEM